jgi:non-homologous end joining protein Ku
VVFHKSDLVSKGANPAIYIHQDEIAKRPYVSLDRDDLEKLEATASQRMKILQFLPLQTVDLPPPHPC